MSLQPLIRESEPTDDLWRRKVRDVLNATVRRMMGQGLTAERPRNPEAGTQFYDRALSKPVWFDGTVWRDAAGVVA